MGLQNTEACLRAPAACSGVIRKIFLGHLQRVWRVLPACFGFIFVSILCEGREERKERRGLKRNGN